MAGLGTNLGSNVQRNWRVLVVDDEENLNWSLVTSLRKEQYSVVGALTAEDALRRLNEATFDCVISDVKMPGMDGFELVQWLRERQPQTRVIMMTAFGSPTVRQSAIRAGVVAYLEKPFDLQLLKQELRRALESGPSAQQVAYDLAEVAQVINLTRRDLVLQAHTGEQQGMLRFAQGELIWAETETLKGDDAFLSLCSARAVRLRTLPWDGRMERNVNSPLNRLLFLALSQRDPRAMSAAPAPPSRPLPPGGASRPTTLSSLPSIPPTASTPSQAPTPGPPYSGPLAPPMSAGGVRSTAGQTTGAAQSEQGGRAPDASAAVLAALQATMTPPLTALATMFTASTLLALARADGAVIAQAIGSAESQTTAVITEAPAGVYGQLAQAAQAVARATLLANWGALIDFCAVSSERLLFVKRLTRNEPAGGAPHVVHTASAMCYLCIVTSASANPDSLRMAVGAHEQALLAALHAGMQAVG